MQDSELKAYVLAQAALGNRMMGALAVNRLVGPDSRLLRQNIMSALQGARVPVSKCGVGAVRTALLERFKVPADCIRNQDEALQAILES